MVTGRIKLGAYKELSRKSLSRDQLEGFFYGGQREALSYGTINNIPLSQPERAAATGRTQVFRNASNWLTAGLNPARQHLILQTICAGLDYLVVGEAEIGTAKLPLYRNLPTDDTPAPAHLFYDNPSSKRVARCTNILHTGATLSGVGEGQRLSWGFGKWRWLKEVTTKLLGNCQSNTGLMEVWLYLIARVSCQCKIGHPFSKSLNSAAEIRHSARNTMLQRYAGGAFLLGKCIYD